MTLQPSLFVSHGAPTLILEDVPARRFGSMTTSVDRPVTSSTCRATVTPSSTFSNFARPGRECREKICPAGGTAMKTAPVLVLLLVMIGGLLLAGCTQNQAAIAPAPVAKIGVVASMTGPASATGKDMWQSALIAADEINAQGGVYVQEFGRNVTIELVQGDDESTREGGQKAVSKLISSDGVAVLVGGFSSAVTSAHQPMVADTHVNRFCTNLTGWSA